MRLTTAALGAGWLVAAVLIVILWMRSDRDALAPEGPEVHSVSPSVDDETMPVRTPVPASTLDADPSVRAVPTSDDEFQRSEYYQRALARVLLPEPTGNADVDRRNGLRHRLRNSGLYDPDSFAGPVWSHEQIRADRRINPDGIELEDRHLDEIGRLLVGDLEERKVLWHRRLALEGTALERAIDAGAIDWFGPTAPHQDPALSTQEQQLQFQSRMTEVHGPMGLGWTCMMTDVRGEQCLVYVTRLTAPELFVAIRACLAQERAGLEAAKRYVASLPR